MNRVFHSGINKHNHFIFDKHVNCRRLQPFHHHCSFDTEMSNIFSTFFPFYIFLKLFGNFSLSFEGPTVNGKFKKKTENVFLFCIVSCIIITFLALNIRLNFIGKASSNLLNEAWGISVIFILLICFVNHVYQAVKGRKLVEFLMILDLFDKKVILKFVF